MTSEHPALVVGAAMRAANVDTLGELVDFCAEHGVKPVDLADATRCRNCGALDRVCESQARESGVTCCTQCRDWPMHGQRHTTGEPA